MRPFHPTHRASGPPVRRTTPLQWAVGLLLLAGLVVFVALVFAGCVGTGRYHDAVDREERATVGYQQLHWDLCEEPGAVPIIRDWRATAQGQNICAWHYAILRGLETDQERVATAQRRLGAELWTWIRPRLEATADRLWAAAEAWLEGWIADQLEHPPP